MTTPLMKIQIYIKLARHFVFTFVINISIDEHTTEQIIQ